MNSSSKMKMNSKRELHQLYSQFVRIWKSGEKAKLNLRSENGAVKACLEINLGNSHAAPTDASTATSGRPQDHEARRTRRHRSAASKARSPPTDQLRPPHYTREEKAWFPAHLFTD